MQIITISPEFSVADQITEADVAHLAAAGFKTVVANRPDGEGGPPMDLIGSACRRHGLQFFSLPVEYSTMSQADADHFAAILRQSEEPLLAYCRSGRRSAGLWAMAMAPLMPVQALIDRLARAGIDVQDLRPRLEQSARAGSPIG